MLAPVLAMVLLAAPARVAAGSESDAVTVAFSSDHPAAEPAKLRAPSGTDYVVQLRPDPDVNGEPVVLDLVLRSVHGRTNLLEPRGRWHGLQPFNFVASEFGHPPAAYGDPRRIDVPNLGIRVTVKVLDASVTPVSGTNASFTQLRLHVALQPLKAK